MKKYEGSTDGFQPEQGGKQRKNRMVLVVLDHSRLEINETVKVEASRGLGWSSVGDESGYQMEGMDVVIGRKAPPSSSSALLEEPMEEEEEEYDEDSIIDDDENEDPSSWFPASTIASAPAMKGVVINEAGERQQDKAPDSSTMARKRALLLKET
ncbi:hypothetical protein L6452_19177 [Arctium lappa]|uniref:Uncharacterized protein n=1 Tax=Arctium lappa TaxID=4217 RepID=A0ACB9B8Q9_ARCLA|nr:hypothetical protein L6452_19177 [Arctium lappa]